MEKKIIVLFAISLLMFAILQGRLMELSTNFDYISAQENQSKVVLALNDTRGNILDRNFNRLTNTTKTNYELVCAGNTSYKEVFSRVTNESKNDFFANTRKYKPFLVEVTGKNTNSSLFTFEGTKRYPSIPIAPNIIGYLDNSKNGVSGIEYAYNDILTNSEPEQYVVCYQNAQGGIIKDIEPYITENAGTNNSVMLTLDLEMQRICEAISETSIDKGCIIVLNSNTGRILASVSKPDFDPNDIAKSLNDTDAPLINRVISAYTVGSVFKPLLSAAALDTGYDVNFEYFCKGYIEVNKHIFKCAHGIGHGFVNMNKALEESCNCFFVDLGLKLGSEKIYNMAYMSGFGEITQLGNNFFTAKGNLPNIEQLNDKGQLAQVSFGQGALSATPLQIASYMNVFANKGLYIEPSLVEGIADEKENIIKKSLYNPAQRKVISEENASIISKMLQNVVENGLGKSAKPFNCTAAGKTGTAQTGKTINGEDEMNAWFAGYFPAEDPKYTVCVMLDSGTHSSEDACKIFAQVADTFCLYTNKYYISP